MKAQPLPSPATQQSLIQKIEGFQWMARFPALSVMVYLRKDLGVRIVSPLHLVIVSFAMILLSGLVPAQERPLDLAVFALVSLALGLFQRASRWRELGKVQREHSLYIGTSFLEQLFRPTGFLAGRFLSRNGDPLLCVFVGFMLMNVSRALGLWLIFAGICLRCYEGIVHRAHLHRNLDISDGLLNCDDQATVVENFEGGNKIARAPNEPGVPTGLGEDVKANIERRKPEGSPP